jgi:hypothetical protein
MHVVTKFRKIFHEALKKVCEMFLNAKFRLAEFRINPSDRKWQETESKSDVQP